MILTAPDTFPRVCNPVDPNLCLGDGLLNPRAFIPQMRRYPWYPFEDLSFEISDIEVLLGNIAKDSNVYRQSMPCRNRPVEYFEISRVDKEDVIVINDWLSYDEGIIWAPEGSIIINSFSDYVIVALPDRVYHDIYGCSGQDLFEDSISQFKTSLRSDIVTFMSAIRETWSLDRDHNSRDTTPKS